MANTFFGLTIASTGLTASNIAINTTAHNVSNVNTKGYTKQVASMQAGSSIRVYSNYGTVGTGVDVTSIDQLRSSYYDTKYWNNNAYYGQYNTLQSYSLLIENYFDEFNMSGFTTEYANLFEAVNSLVNNDPTSEVARNQFINYSQSLSEYYNTLSENLSNVQKQANDEIRSSVDAINTIAEKIASLNKQINTIEINGGEANDLRDARALLVDDLSTYVNTTVTEKDMGNGATYYQLAINNQTLVDGYNYDKLECEARDIGKRRNASDIDGLYDIKWNNGLYFNIYGDTIKGSLKAAVDIRDGCSNSYELVGLKDTDGNFLTDADGKIIDAQNLTTTEYEGYINAGYSKALTVVADSYHNSEYKGIPYFQAQLNKFAQVFADSFNEIIGKGDLDGEAVPDFFVSKYGDSFVSASNITVNDVVKRDISKLPYSYDNTKGSANNDLVKDLMSLQTKDLINNGTFDEFLKSMVSVISVDTNNAKTFAVNYENVRSTIDNQRLSVSGVDEDEEGVDLVKFQNAYNLASKVISVMQEIYDKLIEQTGV